MKRFGKRLLFAILIGPMVVCFLPYWLITGKDGTVYAQRFQEWAEQ